MRSVLDELDGQMVEPLWPALVETPISIDYTVDKRPKTEHETILWNN